MMQDEQGNTPFQYIITTTTRPSEALQSRDVTKLTLSSGSGSLFRKQLESSGSNTNQTTLFDESEEA